MQANLTVAPRNHAPLTGGRLPDDPRRTPGCSGAPTVVWPVLVADGRRLLPQVGWATHSLTQPSTTSRSCMHRYGPKQQLWSPFASPHQD